MRSDWERDAILQLPGNSVTSWIILREYINSHADNGSDIKIVYPTGLKPTRKNVLDGSVLRTCGYTDWFRMELFAPNGEEETV